MDTLCASTTQVEGLDAVLADPDRLRAEFDAIVAASWPDAANAAAPPRTPVTAVAAAAAAPAPCWTQPGPGRNQPDGTGRVLRAGVVSWRRERSPPHVR